VAGWAGVSLITGPEWERAVGVRLRSEAVRAGWRARKAQPPGHHKGKGTRFSGAGPADYQLEREGRRVAVEVKTHTDRAHARWPFASLKLSQAEDLAAADRGVVLLRVAGYADECGGMMSANVPDMVYLLDWTDLGPLWWTWAEWASIGPGDVPHGMAGLTEGDARRLAVAGFAADGVRMVSDQHGTWTCPPVVGAILGGL